MLTRSRDEGEIWSEPRVLPRPAEDRLASLAVSGESVIWLTVGDRYEVCVLE